MKLKKSDVLKATSKLLTDGGFINMISDAIYKRAVSQRKKTRPMNDEEFLVKEYVRKAKDGDVFMDLTASDVIKKLREIAPMAETPNLSAVRLGKALSSAGFMQVTRNGRNQYAVKAVKKQKDKAKKKKDKK